MATTALNLASPILLFVATFRRKARRGTTKTGTALHEQVLELFREQDQRAEVESGLSDIWAQARKPLAYLVDEVLSNTEWEYRGWWSDHTLETKLLEHPQKMRGIRFYDELEQARRQLGQLGKEATSHRRQTLELLTIFYVCLQMGFEGKFAGQPQELDNQAQQIYKLLPESTTMQTRHLYDDAYKHTIEIPPNYQTVMRLATIIAVLVGMVMLFVGFREILYNDLLGELQQAAEQAGDYFSTEHVTTGMVE